MLYATTDGKIMSLKPISIYSEAITASEFKAAKGSEQITYNKTWQRWVEDMYWHLVFENQIRPENFNKYRYNCSETDNENDDHR